MPWCPYPFKNEAYRPETILACIRVSCVVNVSERFTVSPPTWVGLEPMTFALLEQMSYNLNTELADGLVLMYGLYTKVYWFFINGGMKITAADEK